jgi:nucleoside-diphosphate-sugar epimerase
MSKLLVTGSSGSIGGAFQTKLSELGLSRWDLVLWDRGEFGSFLESENRLKVLRDEKPDIVVHFAWAETESENYDNDPIHTMWAEESGNFMEQCEDIGAWFVGMGSAIDAGELNPQSSPYANAKKSFRNMFETDTVSSNRTLVRPQYVISIDRKHPRVLNYPINQVREPYAVHDFIDVRDVASGISAVLLGGLRGLVDIGSGRLHSISKLKSSVNHEFHNEPCEVCDLTCEASNVNIDKLTALAWEPVHTAKLFRCQAILGT